MTARFLARSRAYPALWVRGVWRTPGYRPFELDGSAGQVICHRGPYPVRVQTHERWNSRMNSSTLPRNSGGENPWSEESLVKEWANTPGPACHLDVYAPEPMDYADRRGWTQN